MANGRLWTQEELDIVRAEYAVGGKGNAAALALKLNRGVTAVRSAARKMGVLAEPPWTEEQISILRERYPTEGAIPLQSILGRSQMSIFHKARLLGILCPNKFLLQSRSKYENCKSSDIHFFEKWSADMAYILGYIWADGAVITKRGQNRLQFSCVSEDEEIIYFVRDALKSKHKIGILPAGVDKRGVPNRQQTRIYICSRVMVECLVNQHGLEQNKSNIDLPYPVVPDEWFSHFVRGNFDGDGHVGQYIVAFSGSRKFICGLQSQICRILNLPAMRVQESPPMASAHWYDRNHRLAIYHMMYPAGGSYFYLKRKRQAFEEALGVI